MAPSATMKSWFITGTDTGVGKTLVSAALLRLLHARGERVAYMKPIQTGCEEKDGHRLAPDQQYCLQFAGLQPDEADLADGCPYRLLMPASPHLAAAREGVTISIDRIMEAYHRLQTRHDRLIVEGAGGVLAPINERTTILDIIKRMDLPVIVVCRAGLGTLNHTQLTTDRLRQEGLTVKGLVIVETQDRPWGAVEEDNVTTLKRTTGLPLIGRVPFIPDLAHGTTDSRTLSDYFRTDLIFDA